MMIVTMITGKKYLGVMSLILLMVSLLVFTEGCGVYFNTFFNCKKHFNMAEKVRKGRARGGGGQNDYNIAIEKARKVVDNYPNSKYYDDALYILASSYFHTRQYTRAERRFRELLANYAESEFAKESKLYLAKTKLELNEVDEAMVLFEDVFGSDYNRKLKAEAAMALGEYSNEEEDYEQSRSYFMSVRDSLGDETQSKAAQIYMADGYFESFQFGNAHGSYLQVLGMDPDKNERYHALAQAALCSYRLLDIEGGMEYLTRLAEDELYYDSLFSLKMKMAKGYEIEDDLVLAEEIYEEVAVGAKKKLQSQAYYRLGLIYQYDYDQLKEAKEYYDKSTESDRGSEWGREALQRSSAIGKIETFTKSLSLDSAATQQEIDDAAYTQYLLSGLYWFDLNKPDTAILEMQYVIDSFPTAFDVPKALIALSQMYREHHKDDAVADSLLRLVLEKHPRSDYIPEALGILDLMGSEADTGYAALYYHKAEDFFVDSAQYDSAIYYYQYVVDSFPDSKFNLQAAFNVIWLTEMHLSPGDSSVIFAYQAFVDSFPGTTQAREASMRLRAGAEKKPPVTDMPETGEDREDGIPGIADTLQAGDTAVGYVDPMIALYVGPEGEKLTNIDSEPTEIEDPFEFPEEAFTMQEDAFYLYFQIKVDFSGKVLDNILKIPSQYEDVNRLAGESVASMTFDPLEVSKLVSTYNLMQSSDGAGYWLVYKFLVEKPDFLR